MSSQLVEELLHFERGLRLVQVHKITSCPYS